MNLENLKEHDLNLIAQLKMHHSEAADTDYHIKITLRTALGLVMSMIKNQDAHVLKDSEAALKRILKAFD